MKPQGPPAPSAEEALAAETLAARTAELEREIEARQHAEEALRASEARYRSIVESAGEGIWTIDATARTSFVNPKMAEMMGYAPEEMQGRALVDFMDDEWRAIAGQYLGRRQHGIAEEHEFKFRRKDGSDLWALLAANPIEDSAGTYTGALALVHDITERRIAQEHLRATEARFRSLFEHAPICLWEEDLSAVKARLDHLRASGVTDLGAYLEAHPDEVARCLSQVKVLDVNEAALRLYEAETKADLLAGLSRILTPESYGALTRELIALVRGETVFESEAIDQTLTGRRNHVLLKVLIAPGHEATWSRVYVSIVDITARKQAEDEARKLEEQLRQSQKMEAIGHLAGGIAHDFNNLLTVINGNAAMLQTEDLSAEQRTEALTEISRATERATALTGQLLTFSRRQVLRPRELDVNEVVTDLSKMLRRVLGEDLRLQLKLYPRSLFVRADAGMLDQVLVNLAVNARDAMPQGGDLVIETDETTITPNDYLRFPEVRSGPHVCLRVSDTGCGMSPELLEHIFEPFFTTKEIGKGTGLGLATVFGIVKQHAGALRVTSARGQGTTFEVVLPASEGTVVSAAAKETLRAPRGGTESILLVEDEEPVRRLAQRLLERGGYRVRVATTGAEALLLCEQGLDKFDLVVTDMVMPGGISGHMLAERLATGQPALKVIYMSGYAGDVAGRSVDLREGVNFLQKPFAPAALLACVRARLDAP